MRLEPLICAERPTTGRSARDYCRSPDFPRRSPPRWQERLPKGIVDTYRLHEAQSGLAISDPTHSSTNRNEIADSNNHCLAGPQGTAAVQAYSAA